MMTLIKTYCALCPSSLLLSVIAMIMLHQSEALPPWFMPPDACDSTHRPAPYTGPVPPLPVLPKQYSLRVEANIIQKRWTTEVEEHYDSINQRASLAVSFNGSTIYSIFNFKSGERYDIYPNGTCLASAAEIDYYGLVKMVGPKQTRPALSTINEVFKFGQGFNQTYVGKNTVRGIPVNHWTSCREWQQWGARFQLDFYFADPDFISASGGVEIPVRIILNGSANNVGMSHEALEGRHRFEHVYDFVSVRPGAPKNEEVFQVPMGVICQGRQDTKPMPELPDRFEMSTEMVVPEVGMAPKQNYLSYDWPHRLLETGIRMAVPQAYRKLPGGKKGKYSKGSGGTGAGAGAGMGSAGSNGGGNAAGGVPSGDDDEALTLVSVSTVQDFNTGLVYVLDKMNMTCSAHMMPQSTQQLGMSHGANLFHPATRQTNSQSGFSYQGQTYLRRMLVDVWALEENGITQELHFLAERDESMLRPSSSSAPRNGTRQPGNRSRLPYPVLVGMYTKNSSANADTPLATIFQDVFKPDAMQWTGLATTPGPAASPAQPPHYPRPMDRIPGDQLAFGVQMGRMLEQRLSHKLVHVYNYQPMHTESSNFQVSLCYPDDQVSQVMVVVRTSYDEDVLQSFAAFSNNLRQAIAKSAGVSLLQVANLVPMPMGRLGNNMTTVTLSLLGKPIPTAHGQLTLAQAQKNLQAAIQRGIVFTVEYSEQSKSFIVDKDLFFLDYDSFRADKAPARKPADGSPGKMRGGGVNPSALGSQDEDDSQGGGGGYSGGALAGVAFAMLAVGLMGGLGLAYFIYRRQRRGDCSVPYQMTS
ncbi:hypothetical protein PoB_005988900 [Plakobranchus ocellatus]|uniref:LolA-like domain-containing protein n=1 Tax=Plakobranchus ocellatus TaxID=259542 RepID=A0AAV4CND4_9GAST|nr:hypothetical protein PoB_005988900 [Plakobranchus ocellatus]